MSEQDETIDLRVLLKVLISHIIPIVIVTIIAGGIGFSVAEFFVPKRYTSEALMYVENSSSKQEDSAINVNDINAAQKLVNTCQILFTSDYVMSELSNHFDGRYSKGSLKSMVNIESVNSTEVLRVTVESGSAQDSYDIAGELIVLATDEFHRIIKSGSIETVSMPTMPTKHNYPSTTRFTIIGALAGFVLIYGILLVKELLDTKVKPEDNLAVMYDLPVFAEILDFETAGKSGYKYSKYGRYGSYSSYDTDINKEESIFSEKKTGNDDKKDSSAGDKEVKRKNGKEK